MKLADFLFNRTQMPTISSGLDAYSLRQKSIANNIANIETPGYQRKEVSFEEEFRKAMQDKNSGLTKTDDNHRPKNFDVLNVSSELKISQDTYFNGINNVNIEKESANLAKTQIQYEAMTKLARKQLNLLKDAIRGT